MGDLIRKTRARKRKPESDTELKLDPSRTQRIKKSPRKRKRSSKVSSLVETQGKQMWIKDNCCTKPSNTDEEKLSPLPPSSNPYCNFLHTALEGACHGLHPRDMNLKPICKCMTLRGLGIEGIWDDFKNREEGSPVELEEAPIIFQKIYEDALVSVVLFHMYGGAGLPLHDHPGMNGFSYVLSGRVQHTSYTMEGLLKPPNKKAGWCTVYDAKETCLDAMITDSVDGNIHTLTALENCSILQLLVPPYNRERKCTYYKIGITSGDRVWLDPIRAPSTYQTRSLPYKGCSFVDQG